MLDDLFYRESAAEETKKQGNQPRYKTSHSIS